MQHPVIVLKFGGSVLRDESDLATGVHEIYRWLRDGYRVVAVVSAFEGTTDSLIAKARSIAPDEPVSAPTSARALLLSTGEFSTAALLTLALVRAGIHAAVLNPHQLALRTKGDGADADPASINQDNLRRALDHAGVVVVPGFIGVGQDNGLTLLGRGGSDMTALFIAATLRARCRLIKDVDGLYDRDPALPGPPPRRFATLPWDRALELDGGIVQHKAVRLARHRGLFFEVGSFHREDVSLVSNAPARWHALQPDQAQPAAPLRVAILGLGTVGCGVATHVLRDPARFTLTGALVRTLGTPRDVPALDRSLITTDPARAVQGADVVIELLGGTEPARSIIGDALAHGTHVVSANKALIAAHADELLLLAERNGALLRYSAAVGGAVPMLETVARFAGRVHSIEGVVNGTTNFVLNLVTSGVAFEDAVREAQRLGYAEQNPTRDLSGADALDKLLLLARAAFPESGPVRVVRLSGLDSTTIRNALESLPAGDALRLIAWAQRVPSGVEVGVELRPVPAGHPLATLPGATNCLVVHMPDAQPVTVRGAGAGRWPTAESVIADLHDISRHVAARANHTTTHISIPGASHAS